MKKKTEREKIADLIEILSNNETVPEKVKVQDIEEFNKVKKIHALQKLINLCKEMEQGLLLKADFIKARDTIECVICHKEVRSKDHLHPSGRCNLCEKEIEKAKKQKVQKVLLLKNWKQLEKDLKKFNGAYTLDLTANIIKIKRAVRLKDKTSVVFKIYRDDIYSGSSFHQRITGHALRITSDTYSLEALRLMKDFGGKNVAEGLHNKIEKLISDYEVKIQVREERKNKQDKFVNAIIKDLGITEDAIENCYIYPRGRMKAERIAIETKEVRFQGIRLRALYSLGKVTYLIGGIPKKLTASQVEKIAKLVNTF